MADMSTPLKGVAFTLSFTLYKNDGTIVANPGTYTKKVSVDGGAVGNIAASVTEEDTTYGQLSLVLATDEMNGDVIWVYVTDDTAGTVPFTCSLYPAAGAPASAAALTVIDDFLDTEVAAILADTNELQTDWVNGGRLDLLLDGASAPSAATVADAVWDEALSGHATGGSSGAALTGAGSAGDPWVTAIPGAYGAGTAGKIVGDNINAPIATVDTVVDGIATDVAATHVHAAAAESQTTAGSIAAAVWGALVASYTTAVTFGKYLGGAPSGATVAADVAAVKADTGLSVKGRFNKVVSDPATGVETVYDDNSTTPLKAGPAYEDVAGTMPFDGTGANRRDRMT